MPTTPDADDGAERSPYNAAQNNFTAQDNAAPPQRNVMAEAIERHERVTNRVKNAKK
ncbi:MAG: hypothetical protein K2N47_04435 [Clostridia bacterium]|nr:hypothetical protein [Clostridia bacterium]